MSTLNDLGPVLWAPRVHRVLSSLSFAHVSSLETMFNKFKLFKIRHPIIALYNEWALTTRKSIMVMVMHGPVLVVTGWAMALIGCIPKISSTMWAIVVADLGNFPFLWMHPWKGHRLKSCCQLSSLCSVIATNNVTTKTSSRVMHPAATVFIFKYCGNHYLASN